MKFIRSLVAGLSGVCALALAGYASNDLFSIKTAVTAPPPQQEVRLSLAAGDILEFSAADLEKRLSLAEGELRGVTVTTLPEAAQGALVLEGVEVDPYQFISRQELESLCFVPNETAAAASLTLLPQGTDSVSTRLSISVLRGENKPPLAEGGSYDTLPGIRLSGEVVVTDPEGDAVAIQVLTPPRKGALSFQGRNFLYIPFQGCAGADSFTYCAVDRFGNYSGAATVDIKIDSRGSGLRFADMAGNPSEYAAVQLAETGVFSGEKVGGAWFFHPERPVTRGDFLVMTLAAADMDGSLPATVNTRLDGDAELPMWLKPYLKRALNEGVWNLARPFRHDQIPTRAEAVQLVALASKIHDVKDFSLAMPDVTDIPLWALPSYKDLAAYRMLDLHDGYARPDAALDNAYAADLLWQLYKHTHR